MLIDGEIINVFKFIFGPKFIKFKLLLLDLLDTYGNFNKLSETSLFQFNKYCNKEML